jgi:hypothetical protein
MQVREMCQVNTSNTCAALENFDDEDGGGDDDINST